MKIKNEFTPYEQALALKELGFEETCFAFYNNAEANPYIKQDLNDELKEIYTGDFEAPLYQQAFRWFKEKYGLMSCITPCSDGEYIFTLYDLNKCDLEVFVEDIEIMESEDSYEFFEEAELECLKKLIEIVKLSHKTATL